MRQYIVYRHNLNDPSGRDKVAVARLGAGSEEEACALAAQREGLANEKLSARPADEVDAREANRNLTARALGGYEPVVLPATVRDDGTTQAVGDVTP
jgi:hypothetical protein